jgi:polyisoprenoid-binding protein YceI
MQYLIDDSRGRFVAQAFSKGMLSAFGHDPRLAIRDFEGELEFDPAAPNASTLRMTAKADSLHLIDDVSEKDRLEIERTTREEILDANRYPQINFRSVSVAMYQTAEGQYQTRIIGDLTVRGVTCEYAIDLRVRFEDRRLLAEGRFPVRQSDFKIKPVSVAGGLLQLKDEVQLSFSILARPLSA